MGKRKHSGSWRAVWARLDRALKPREVAGDDTGFAAWFIVHGSLGALNAGEGAPSERIRESMEHLPEMLARIGGMDSRKLTSGERA